MKKLQLIFAVAALISVLVLVICSSVIAMMAGKLDSQNAVSRWVSDGTGYAQISAFLTPEAGIRRMTVERTLTEQLDRSLIDASLEAPDEDARLYTLSASAETVGRLELTDDYGRVKKSGVSATVTAISGDYFIFHPEKLLSGYYFSTTDILNDCVIIDNDIAWQFFGSYDVVGRSFLLDGRRVYISGVSESGAVGDYSEFYGDKPRIYIAYSLAEELYGELPAEAVEILLPDPIDGFALEMFKNALNAPEEESVYVENSARFSDENLRLVLRSFSDRGVSTSRVVYPFYENTAIKLVNRAALVYIGKLLSTAILVIIAAAEVVILYIKRRSIVSFIKKRVSDRLSKARREREYRKQSLKATKGDTQ